MKRDGNAQIVGITDKPALTHIRNFQKGASQQPCFRLLVLKTVMGFKMFKAASQHKQELAATDRAGPRFRFQPLLPTKLVLTFLFNASRILTLSEKRVTVDILTKSWVQI